MKCKICGTGNAADLECAVRAGADAVGFIVGTTHLTDDAVSPAAARHMIQSLPPFVSGVVVTHLTSRTELVRIVSETGCAVLQIQDMVEPADMEYLHDRFAYLKIIKAVHVTGESAVATAERLAVSADALILDSRTRDRLGGTGITHDWGISARIVEAVDVPVILAGGLKPENLRKAISEVKPYAVDVHSGVKKNGVRDFERTKQFADIAHG
ncbi:MAG: phosphoribosylanthranilate isomerase, partial [Methanocorpusculum sp.]|nr:phosphoribosylanthranilate isomerase [Methanocorpusculum sp.]